MNCDDFGQLMNQRLDERLPIEGDEELRRHACQCDSCRAQLEAWRQIAAIMPVREPVCDQPKEIRWMPWVAMAAVMLIAVTVHWNNREESPLVDSNVSGSTPTESLESPSATILAQASELDPVGWWRGIQNRDWIGQTMPTVKSVQEGVAPLGRSLMRAATMLTVGGLNQTS